MEVVKVTNFTSGTIYEKTVRNGFSAKYEADCIVREYCSPGDMVKWEVVERIGE